MNVTPFNIVTDEPPKPAPIRRFQLQLADLMLWSIYLGGVLLYVPMHVLLKAHIPAARLGMLALLFLVPTIPVILYGLTTVNGRRWTGLKRMLCWSVLFVPLAIAQTGIVIKFSRSMIQNHLANQAHTVFVLCEQFHHIQENYRRTDWDRDGEHEYASSLKKLSEAGLIAPEWAAAEGPNGIPYNGYLFKILTAQGASEAGGARDYFVGSHLKLGYAIVAVPVVEPELKDYGIEYNASFMFNASGSLFLHPADILNVGLFLNSITRLETGNGWSYVCRGA